ncbi:hypothetical protein ACHQM5_028650 [Ranunculus cassubicifolius]
MARGLLPFFAMVLVQLCYAGMNIVTKLVVDNGMSPFVMITYRQIFATIALAPFAYFLERRTLPKMTMHIIFLIFLCSILGITLNQCFYVIGLKHSTATIATAMGNLLPAITFVMAVPFRMETVLIKKITGQAKVLGTIICVSGAMIMSLYHGKLIHIFKSSLHWNYATAASNARSSGSDRVSLVGPMFVIASCVACSGWFIVQGKLNKIFIAPYTITGVVVSAVACVLMSWVIKKRGALYVSAFNPLVLVIVAVFGWGLLDEKIYVGSIVGSILIVAGLYTVLWGKEKEIDQDMENEENLN